MNLRATGVLLVLAVAVYGVAWWSESRRESTEQAESDSKVVVELGSDSVTGLELPSEDEDVGSVRLVRDEGDWVLERPIAFPADVGVVEDILRNLERLEAQAVIEDRPEDLEPFGLEEGAEQLRVLRGDEAAIELRIGGKTPVGSDRYVARGDVSDRLYTVAQHKLDPFSPGVFALRDKRLTPLEADEVDSLRVLLAGHVMVAAERRDADPEMPASWTLLEPAALEADSERLHRLVQDVIFTRASQFLDAPEALGEYGLDPAPVVVELGSGESSERVELAARDEKAYAHVPERHLVVEVPKRLYDSIPRELFAYRFKQVLRLERGRLDRIVVHFPRDDTSFEFQLDDGAWRPVDPEVAVAATHVDDLVFSLQDLDAVGIEETSFEPAALGLEPARVRFVFRDADGQELGWLELGDPQIPEGMAARSSESDAVWRVANELGEDVPLGLEAFQNRWIEKPEPEAARASRDAGSEEPDAAP